MMGKPLLLVSECRHVFELWFFSACVNINFRIKLNSFLLCQISE